MKNVVRVDAVEIPLEKLGRHRLDGFGVVGRRPCLSQRILVDVGGIDLDPLPILGGAEGLGQQHRQAVGLLPGRTTCTPHPDRVIWWSAGQEFGNDVGLEVLPGVGIAEEGGDVDQNGVEQGGELV